MNAMNAVLVALLVVLASPTCYGQTSSTWIGLSTYRGTTIPNPDNPLSIAVLAVNPTVAAELNLEGKQLKALKSLFREGHGSLEVVTYESKDGEVVLDAKGRALHYQETLQARRNAIEEVLTPEDLKRLRQAAFQIEIARSGFGVAITSGALSENVGVSDNQKSHLREKANQIEAKLQGKIAKLLVEAQEEMVNELPAEQREKAKECLGNPFFYREDKLPMRSLQRFDD